MPEPKKFSWPRLSWKVLNKIKHEGRYCGDQLCCWGPAGKKEPRSKEKKGGKDG